MQRLVSAIALCALATTATAQLQVVIPAGCDIAPGNTSNAFPWGTTASAWPGLRLMCVYGATNFTSQNVNAPILINQLKWRPDNNAPAYTGGTFSTATVQLSTSPTGWNSVTTNYATNHGANVTTVYSGPVVHTPTPGTAAWTVTSWCVDITLTTPFLYDPSQGDLVIDVDYPTGSFTGGTVGQMDVQSTNSNASRIYASSLYPAANGITQNHGVVVEVGYMPPSGFAFTTSYGTGCVDRASATVYETFPNSTFDLSNTSWQFVPTGQGYAILPAAPQWFTPTNPVTLGDDQVSGAQPLGFTLNYPGGSTTDVYISSNGFVWAQSNTNSACCTGDPVSLRSQGARWCALWNDLNPSAGGQVYFDTDPVNGAAYVTFNGVVEYGTTNPNTFQIAYFSNGTVEYRFQSCTIASHVALTGWSPGANNQDPGPVDFSAAPVIITEPDLRSITHSGNARPVIGSVISLSTNNVAPSALIGATLFGLAQFNPGIDLTSIGMPGCHQYVSIDASQVWIAAGGVGSTNFSIPNNPGLAGVEIKTQGAALVPGINALGALTTNGLKHTLDIN